MASVVEAPNAADIEHFTEVYQLHSPGIRAFTASRLVWRDEHLAEDIVSEAFAEYWRSFVLRHRYADTNVFNLLATIARRRAWALHNNTRSVRDAPVDFEDVTRWRLDAMTASALDASSDPERLAQDLDAALDVMSAAGKTWRRTRQVVAGIKGGTASVRSRCGDAHVAKYAASLADRLARASAAEQAAVEDFRAARAEVSKLRDLLNPQ